MIKKSAVLVGNDEFWHSAIIDDSCTTTTASTDSSYCDKGASSIAGLPEAHHQLLSDDVPSYECLTGYDHRGEDVASSSLFFDEDDDMLSSTHHDDVDDEDDDVARMTSCCRQEKMSSVKKRGGGSWLLGFARLQSRPSVDDTYSDDEEEEQDVVEPSKLTLSSSDVEQDDNTPPGLVRTNSESDLSFSTTSSSDDGSDDDNSTSTSSSKPKKKSVGFNTTVKIQPIPHASIYSPLQRRKMYSSSLEVRKNKIRNKKEYRYDGYDWRNVTEEWEMSVDMVTGELIHPVHNHMH